MQGERHQRAEAEAEAQRRGKQGETGLTTPEVAAAAAAAAAAAVVVTPRRGEEGRGRFQQKHLLGQSL